MELVETVGDVEAVVHRQGSIADDVGGGEGVTGVVVSGEELSDLREGLYTPLGTANIGAVQANMEARETARGCGRSEAGAAQSNRQIRPKP